MKKTTKLFWHLLIGVVIVLVGTLAPAMILGEQVQAADDSGYISGTVIDDTTGSPIEGADVFALDLTSYEWKGGSRTDGFGNYTFAAPSGQWIVRAKKEGYIPEFYQDKLAGREANPVSVTAEATAFGVDFALTPSGYISGTVIDDTTGIPIEGADVFALDPTSYEYKGGSRTDASGNYTFAAPSGQWIVRAKKEGYVSEFYQDKLSGREANPVLVTAGETVSRVDFALAPAGYISGTVIDDTTGIPIEGADVFALDPTSYEYKGGSRTDELGNYTFAAPSGQWIVPAEVPGYAQQFYEGTPFIRMGLRVEVEVGQTTPGINFNLEPAGTISGTVTDEDGIGLTGICVRACLPFSMPLRPAYTDTGGKYTFGGVPYGEYYVSAGTYSSYATQFYKVPEETAPSTVVVSAETPNPSDINFSLKQPSSSISGTVMSSGSPVSGALVRVISSLASFKEPDNPYDPSVLLIYGDAFSDADGSYRINGLPSGVKLWAEVAAPGFVIDRWDGSTSWQDATSLNLVEGEHRSGVNFNVAAGAGTIEGYVFEGDGTTPIQDARVEVYTSDHKYLAGSIPTTLGGRYSVGTYHQRPFLPPGEHQARVFAPGYADKWQTVTVPTGNIARVDFTLSQSYSTDAGENITVSDSFNKVNVTFDNVTESGNTWVNVTEEPPAPTEGFAFLDKYYDVSTDASYSGNIGITITYDDADIPPEQSEENLRLYHWTGSAWEDVTVSVDTVNNKVTGAPTSLSWLVPGIGSNVTWLPPLCTGEVYLAQDGRTVPVKFQLTDANGSLVSTAQVIVTITRDSDGAKVLSGLATYEPDIPGYRINAQTEDWALGNYTIHLSVDKEAKYGMTIVQMGQAKGKGG